MLERVLVRGNFKLRDLGLGRCDYWSWGYSFSPEPTDRRKILPGPSQTLGLQFHFWSPGVSGVNGVAMLREGAYKAGSIA